MGEGEKYIPAFGHDLLSPLYDPMLRWIMRESRFKRQLVEQARIEAGHRVLDLGCGTGTLTILLKRAHPEAEVVGLDGDPKILDIARTKARTAGADITFNHGMAFQLPYSDDSFDRVLSSLVLHHLTTENKRLTLREVVRALRPGGELHAADFGKPHNAVAATVSLITRRFEEASDNIEGVLPEMFRGVGFDQVEETDRYLTVMGTLSLYRGRKPERS